MSMTEKALNKFVEVLPPGEQTRAKQRIRQAEKFGWQNIEYWDYNKNPRLSDLVGLDAGGRFDFLPRAEEEED